jgi:phospholipid/cholesterol/gamma-HCH transport system substrate-binding protein
VQVERIAGRMDRSSESLQDILANVRQGKGTLGRLAYDDRLYEDLDSLAINLNLLVKDLRENPGRYVNVSVF